jgi:hypothetical protein
MDWIDLAQDRDRWRTLVTRQWTFGFHKMREISWLAENWLASQRLCSMQYGDIFLESVTDNTKSGRDSKPVPLEHIEECHAIDKNVWFLPVSFIFSCCRWKWHLILKNGRGIWVSLRENQRYVKLQPNPFKTWKNKLFTQAINFQCWLSPSVFLPSNYHRDQRRTWKANASEHLPKSERIRGG